MKVHRVGDVRCYRCMRLLDAATCASGDHAPSPGDITVCLYCGAINQFTSELNLRRAPDDAITIEAVMVSILYWKPIVYETDGKVH